jgi:aspartyl protease family protein
LKRLLAVLLLFAAPVTALAQATVFVMSIAPGKVDFMINGSVVRSLRPGETSPEGVRLARIERDVAIVEVGGRALQMRVGSSTSTSVSLQADRNGQYWAQLLVNGVATRAVVDTGATAVAMNLAEAQRLRVDLSRGQHAYTQTANGRRDGWRVRIAHVQVGDIALANVEGFVINGGAQELPVVLLGMSFLGQLEMQRSGATLVLTRRH